MFLNRRTLISAALMAGVSSALGQEATEPKILDPQGRTLPSFPLPVELSAQFAKAPGALSHGGASPDVIIVEFFDFNCPFCRTAARDLDAILREDADLRLVLLHNAILSPGSVDAAKVALAFFSLRGSAAAYAFYLKLLSSPGVMNGARALDLAASFDIPRKDLEERAQDPRIAAALAKQMELASSSGFSGTPAFEIKGTGVIGYPGAGRMKAIVASVRSCDRIAC